VQTSSRDNAGIAVSVADLRQTMHENEVGVPAVKLWMEDLMAFITASL